VEADLKRSSMRVIEKAKELCAQVDRFLTSIYYFALIVSCTTACPDWDILVGSILQAKIKKE
jgi:hypothetical protein